MVRFGLSFSGGGIRSAAFCSGVLRRLLQKEVQIDYLSCVSGGGYTGSSYVEWKYRHGKKDNKKWHQEFFNHMRENAGLICNSQKPCRAILESVVFCALLFFVSVIAPTILWGSFAHPLAYIIDYLFGHILRGGSRPCTVVVRENPNITLEECENRRQTSDIIYPRFALFALPVVLALVCFILKGYFKRRKGLFNFLAIVFAALFGLVFIPWFMNVSVRFVPDWLKTGFGLSLFFVWISFPLMRNHTTLMVIFYFYSFIVHFRVYRLNALGSIYDDRIFDHALAVSVVLMWVTPVVATIQQSSVHLYVRWIIQKAFYYPKTVGTCACSGISWRDHFLFCPTPFKPRIQNMNSEQALTLDDLDDVTPTYIGCATVNRWRRTHSPREPHFEVLTMSPHSIERLDHDPGEEGLHGKLRPVDIYLSKAAATSAAAVNHDMGGRQGDASPSREMMVMLGLSVGASVVADHRQQRKRNFCIQILPLLIEFLRVAPPAFAVAYYFKTDDENFLAAGVLIHIGISLLLTLMALVPTGEKYPGRLERLARWFTINVSFVHRVHKVMHMTNVGPNPPAVLSLSDGGHLENLGILPLLKLRLKKIVAVDGGRSILDQDYAEALLIALDLARKKLGCSFSAMDGRDIAEDIRDNFVERSPGSQPSNYRFKVHYYDKNVNSDGKTKVGEGEILYIAPKHPDKGIKTSPYVMWEEALRDIDEDLEAGLWGAGPELSSEEANRLTFCCCECCHGNRCRGLSEAICGVFPQQSTGNQLFTPTLFSAYHREGYRASVEANVDQFVLSEQETLDSGTITA